MSETPNPMCVCGCGQEVTRPTNRYIIGRAVRPKLTEQQVAVIKKLLDMGISTYDLAVLSGVSQPWIKNFKWFSYSKRSFPSTHSATLVRREELEMRQQRRRTAMAIRQAMTTLQELRLALKDENVRKVDRKGSRGSSTASGGSWDAAVGLRS